MLGPIDNAEIVLTIEEVIGLQDTHSTYWEVKLINTDPNQLNANGLNERPVKVLSDATISSIDNGTKKLSGSITIAYHGAYSGNYNYEVTGRGGTENGNSGTVDR